MQPPDFATDRLSAESKGAHVASTFLIVDDHPLFREALRLAIESAYADAAIQEASSIEAAKAALNGASYDLVLLDLSMPGT